MIVQILQAWVGDEKARTASPFKRRCFCRRDDDSQKRHHHYHPTRQNGTTTKSGFAWIIIMGVGLAMNDCNDKDDW